MKSAGKARSNGLYRHIRTSKEIIRNLLNDYKNNRTFSKRIFSYRQLKELRIRHGISNYQTSAIAYEEWIILFKCFLQYVSDEKKKQVIGSYRQYLIQESLLKKQFRGRK